MAGDGGGYWVGARWFATDAKITASETLTRPRVSLTLRKRSVRDTSGAGKRLRPSFTLHWEGMPLSKSPLTADRLLDHTVATLGDRLASPTDSLPSVRCVARQTLVALISDAVRGLDVDGLRPPATRVIARMIELGLVHPVVFEHVAPRAVASTVYLLGYGVSPRDVHPFELLQAIAPDGVICYMSAIEQHGLTTQPTAHHHIARLETAPTRVAASAGIAASTRRRVGMPTRHPLGRWQFTYSGVPYYLTTREPRRLRAFQKRYLHAQSWYRLATIEQTLLDTLHRPAHCGGPAVVFEAWEAAASLLDASTLFQLIAEIDDDTLVRQAGYMLEHIGVDATPLLDIVCMAGGQVSAHGAPLLLRDMPYSTFDRTWGVLVP